MEGPDDAATIRFKFPDALAALPARYDVLGEVGRGGMGIVYSARDRQTGDVVALKILHPTISVDCTRIERFKNELLLARRITHKNICRVHDLNEFGGTVVISMELVAGQSLRDLLRRVGSVSIRHGTTIIRQVIAGLAEAHAQGVVHRDLKPENILIGDDGVVKVMDFGIARSVNATETSSGMLVGTPAYMSPEQASGGHGDARSDIYALGVIMYEMFAGEAPFSAETPVAMAAKHVHDTPVPPRERDADLPVRIERVILKCLQKNPADRFQSVGEIEAALDQERAEPAAPEPLAAPLPVHLTQWQRADSALVLAATVGVVLFFFGFYRTSIAPVSQVSFDRSALRRIAQEYSQRLGIPDSSENGIGVSINWGPYVYLARQAGAPVARTLANNPVNYWTWYLDKTDAYFRFNNRGELVSFNRFLPSDSLRPVALPEARAAAERALREFFSLDASDLVVERAGTDGRYANFQWSDVATESGVRTQYYVSITSRGPLSVQRSYLLPPGAFTQETLSTANLGVPAWAGLIVLIAAFGLFQTRRVDMMIRWRLTTSVLAFCVGLGLGVFNFAPRLFEPATSKLALSIATGLAIAALWLVGSAAFESVVKRSGAAKLSSLAVLFGFRALPATCGLAVVRGTLIGLAIMGLDAAAIWVGTTFLGVRLGYDTHLYYLGWLLSGAQWPVIVLLVFSGLEALGIGLLVGFFGAVGARVSGRWRACVLAPALLLAIGDVHHSMAAIQPYYWTMTLLFVDYVLLFAAFRRFDLLTVVTALFTFAFCLGNYSLLVMFQQIGPVEEWAAFVVWGLCIAAAVAVAFQSPLRSAFGRMSAAVE